jgi:pyruvate carboxylase subunit B
MAALTAHLSETMFKIDKHAGEHVAEGDEVIILEAMQTEIPIASPSAGVVTQLLVEEARLLQREPWWP